MPKEISSIAVVALADLLDPTFAIVTEDTPLLEVLMELQTIAIEGCAIVEGDRLRGIFTPEDAIGILATGKSLEGVGIREAMKSPAVTFNEWEYRDIFSLISRMQQHQVRHLPAIATGGELMGVITAKRLLAVLETSPLLRSPIAQEIDPHPICTTPNASLQEIAQLMGMHRVSGVVLCDATDGGKPKGMMSAAEVLQSLMGERSHPPVSRSGIFIHARESLRSAYRQMQQQQVQQLIAIGDRGELLGVVSQTDLLQVFDAIAMYRQLEELLLPVKAEETAIASDIEGDLDMEDCQCAEEKLRQQVEYQSLVTQSALQIRESLNLDDILNTIVTHVRQLLKCDRVLVYQFAPDLSGSIVAESVAAGWTTALNNNIKDACFQEGSVEFIRGYKRAIANIYQAGLTPCHIELLERYEVKAYLVVPIAISIPGEAPGSHLWGLLLAHHCSQPRQWDTAQLDLLDELAVQIALAIQQSELYQQARRELEFRARAEAQLQKAKEELEVAVARRTWQLQQMNQQLQQAIAESKETEKALKLQNLKSRLFAEITLKIRQSLELEEILQTTVTEVQKILQVDRVLIYRVFPDGTGRTITEEVRDGWPAILDIPFPEETFPLEYQELYSQGKVRAISDVEQAYTQFTPCLLEFLEPWKVRAKLIVPVLRSGKLWGFTIAHQCSGPRQWTDFEIELMRQLADQVGIALSQAQLLGALQEKQRRFRAIFNQTFQTIGLLKPDGTVLELNQTGLEFAGVQHEDIVGRPFWELPWWSDRPSDRRRLMDAIARAASGDFIRYEVEVRGVDETVSTIDFSLKPVCDDLGAVVMLIPEGRDISDRKIAEEKIKASLKEKEVLLKEIHHRVKNNLLVVSTLIDFQADYTQDPALLQILEDSQSRIHSMALIHEKLYQSRDLAQINFGEYIESLAERWIDSYGTGDERIQFKFDIEPVHLNIETANPCGLIINELLANSFKHAFPNGREGSIFIGFHKNSTDDRFVLTIGDDGIGFPDSIDFRNTESLGLQLVCTLTTQLEGTIELDRQSGTNFILTFCELNYSQRW